jgi:hypothetical protein
LTARESIISIRFVNRKKENFGSKKMSENEPSGKPRVDIGFLLDALDALDPDGADSASESSPQS